MQMDIAKIVTQLEELGIQERRSIRDDYNELVLLNTPALLKTLTDIFGPAVKKPGEKPSNKMAELTRNYGGIWDNQALFKKDSQNGTIIAMFWPWNDEEHVTLKIAVIKSK